MNYFKPLTFSEFEKEVLKDSVMKKIDKELEEEYALIGEIISKRLERKLTQKELAKKMQTKQSAIARLESAEYNPSFKTLKKIAKALDCKVKVSFVPDKIS